MFGCALALLYLTGCWSIIPLSNWVISRTRMFSFRFFFKNSHLRIFSLIEVRPSPARIEVNKLKLRLGRRPKTRSSCRNTKLIEPAGRQEVERRTNWTPDTKKPNTAVVPGLRKARTGWRRRKAGRLELNDWHWVWNWMQKRRNLIEM